MIDKNYALKQQRRNLCPLCGNEIKTNGIRKKNIWHRFSCGKCHALLGWDGKRRFITASGFGFLLFLVYVAGDFFTDEVIRNMITAAVLFVSIFVIQKYDRLVVKKK